MRYYLDTEFIDKGRTIDLISIGVVAQDGREFYAISLDFDPDEASDWVRENVLTRLESRESGLWKSTAEIRDGIAAFVYDHSPEFWTWGGGTYDWFVVIQLFGGAEHLPEGWRYFANDLMQWCGQMGLETDDSRIPKQGGGVHNALSDARHNKVRYDFLSRYQRWWVIEQAYSLTKPEGVKGREPQ